MPRHEELTDGPDVLTETDEGGAAFAQHDPLASAARRQALDEQLEREMWDCTSMNPQELTRRVVQLAQASNRTANYVQGLPSRDEYDALVLEHAGLREQFTALQTQVLTLVAWYEHAGVKAA